MRECLFKHIPSRLYWGESPLCKNFFDKEELYWRSKNYKKQYDPPYKYFGDITLLVELSVNRSGINNSFSIPSDVLFCIDETKGFERYPDAHIVVMTTFLKSIPDLFSFDFNKYKVEIKLEHDPLNCNYSHSMFRTYFDGDLVCQEKFYELGLDKKKGKQYRKSIRDIFNKLTLASVA